MNFYQTNFTRFKPMLDSLADCLAARLSDVLDTGEAARVIRGAWDRFQRLLPDLPFIGETNPLLNNLVGAAFEMGFYLELEQRGIGPETASRINQLALADHTRRNMTEESVAFVKTVALAPERLAREAAES